jgi:hypothetical protein
MYRNTKATSARIQGPGQNHVKLHDKTDYFVVQIHNTRACLVFHNELPYVARAGLDQVSVQAVFTIENHIVPTNQILPDFLGLRHFSCCW